MRNINEDGIFVGERPMACRFGCRHVAWKILLTPLFVLCVGSVLTVFLDLYVSGIRGLGMSRKELKLMPNATFFPLRSLDNLCIIVLERVEYTCSRASSV